MSIAVDLGGSLPSRSTPLVEKLFEWLVVCDVSSFPLIPRTIPGMDATDQWRSPSINGPLSSFSEKLCALQDRCELPRCILLAQEPHKIPRLPEKVSSKFKEGFCFLYPFFLGAGNRAREPHSLMPRPASRCHRCQLSRTSERDNPVDLSSEKRLSTSGFPIQRCFPLFFLGLSKIWKPTLLNTRGSL